MIKIAPTIIEWRKLKEDAKAPTRTHNTDACYDLYTLKDTLISFIYPIKVYTGISFDIPKGWEGIIRPRSSSFAQKHLEISIGTIDASYHGEIIFFARHYNSDFFIKKGESICQIAFREVPDIQLLEVVRFR